MGLKRHNLCPRTSNKSHFVLKSLFVRTLTSQMIDPELDLVMGGELHSVQSACGFRSTLAERKRIFS